MRSNMKKLDQTSVSLLRGLLTTASILGALLLILFVICLFSSDVSNRVITIMMGV